jgi:hypothetical protein
VKKTGQEMAGNLTKLRSPWLVRRPLRRHPRNVNLQGCWGAPAPIPLGCVGPLGTRPLRREEDHWDNNLCPFCLLHGADEICYSKIYGTKLACLVRSAKSFTSTSPCARTPQGRNQNGKHKCSPRLRRLQRDYFFFILFH